jgi:hypothetical protein
MCEKPCDPITAAQLEGVRVFQPAVVHPAPPADAWVTEMGKLTDYLLTHYPTVTTCDYAIGRSVVDTAITLLERSRARA